MFTPSGCESDRYKVGSIFLKLGLAFTLRVCECRLRLRHIYLYRIAERVGENLTIAKLCSCE